MDTRRPFVTMSLDRLWSQAQDMAHRLPPLTAATGRTPFLTQTGPHGRRQTGPGDAFWQYRPAHGGDAATAIDWRRSAKGDELFVRQPEWAAAQRVWIWLDESPSMDWRSRPALDRKLDRACLIALALAIALTRGGERVGWAMPPSTPSSLSQQLDYGHFYPLHHLPADGLLIVVSDFLLSPDQMAPLAVPRSQPVHWLHVQDPAERSLPYGGHVRFTGCEGEHSLTIRNTQDVAAAYNQRMADHCTALDALALGAGASMTRHVTDQPPMAGLADLVCAIRTGGRA